MATSDPRPRWIFDELPPSGARRGGNPAEHAFRPDLDSFVREVVQNANDQRMGAPEVHFGFTSLTGEALSSFLDACAWASLEPHLAAAAKERGGRRIARALSDLRTSKRLLVLHVEDRHTIGLTGDESEGESHFRALCKDTLYSHKHSEGAGGSYGLGKSVLWTFSGLSSVLFASVLSTLPKGRKSPRLIGRAELPSHAVGKHGYSGSGWYGSAARSDRGQRKADSVWGIEAAVQARMLGLDRAPVSGTSLLVLAFRDPASEEEGDVTSLERDIAAACARWFWPALEMPSQPLRIFVGGRSVDAAAAHPVAPFLECWRRRVNPSPRLEEPGDVVAREVEVELPARRDGGGSSRCRATLLVRMADDRQRDPLSGHVACFRGPGMVVRYLDKSALGAGRSFHAVLAAGAAHQQASPSDADLSLERFLRDAEPPGHDDWVSTPALKETWKRGYAKALDSLRERIGAEIRQALSPRSSVGVRGPDRLAKRFPIGAHGRRAGDTSAFSFSGLRARSEDGTWRFEGGLRPRARDVAWAAEVRLSELGEDGKPLRLLEIAAASVRTLGVTARIADGALCLTVPAGIDEAHFEGQTVRVAGRILGEVVLDVAGSVATDQGHV